MSNIHDCVTDDNILHIYLSNFTRSLIFNLRGKSFEQGIIYRYALLDENNQNRRSKQNIK